MIKIYLAHALKNRKKVRKWELKMEKKYPNITLLNPFYDKNGEGGRKDIKQLDKNQPVKRKQGWQTRLVKNDLRMMLECDYVIAMFDHTIGTTMELVYAHLNHIPCFLITEELEVIIHPWIHHHVTTTTNLEMLENWLKVKNDIQNKR